MRFLIVFLLGMHMLTAQTASTQELLQKAEHAFEQKKYKDCIELCSQLIKIEPKSAKAYYLRAQSEHLRNDPLQFQYGDEGSMILDFRMAVLIDTNYALAFMQLAKVFFGQNKIEQSIYNYNQALAIDSLMVDAWVGKGEAFSYLGKQEEALEVAEHAVKLDPGNPEVYNLRGLVKRELKLYADALADFDKAIALQPKLERAYANKGATYDDMGEFDQAIACQKKALQLHPKFANAWFNLGVAEYKKGDKKAAKRHWEKSVKYGRKESIAIIEQYCK